MDTKKNELIQKIAQLERYTSYAKEIESIVKNLNLKKHTKKEANIVCLNFLEKIRNNYNISVEYIQEKNGFIEAEALININFSKEKLKELLYLLLKTTEPVVYIEEIKIGANDKVIRIKIKQPFTEN